MCRYSEEKTALIVRFYLEDKYTGELSDYMKRGSNGFSRSYTDPVEVSINDVKWMKKTARIMPDTYYFASVNGIIYSIRITKDKDENNKLEELTKELEKSLIIKNSN